MTPDQIPSSSGLRRIWQKLSALGLSLQALGRRLLAYGSPLLAKIRPLTARGSALLAKVRAKVRARLAPDSYPESMGSKPAFLFFRSRRWVKPALWVFSGLAAAGALTFAVSWSWFSRDANSYLAYFALRVPKTITKVLDQNGNVIGIFAEEQRVVIPFGDIPKAFVNALVATEDAGFWEHGGTSMRGFTRAGWKFVSTGGRRREGGSTLTMQLVRTVTAKRQKRLDRKLKEIILARKLEKAYSKKQILEMYANEVWFGGVRYGIEVAAQYYFGKSAPQLNVEECILLVAIINNPAYYNPYAMDPEVRRLVKNRRDHVITRMAKVGYLKPQEATLLMEKPIRLARENASEESIAPYLVEEVRKYLYEKYGREQALNGGLEVTTTLDSYWQVAANEAVRTGLKAVDRRRGFRKETVLHLPDPETATVKGWNRYFEVGDSVRGVILGWKDGKALVRIGKERLEVPKAAFAWAAAKDIQKLLPRGAAPLFEVKTAAEGAPKTLELDQEPQVEGALMAVDPKSGEIRAMVGGYDFNRSKFNRTTQALRQVGSTMKAYVYGAAFEAGMTPATVIQDVPTRFLDTVDFLTITLPDGTVDYKPLRRDVQPYEPKNYERDFWGPIPIWEAIRDSRNVPAVRTLEETGVRNVISFARKCGITGDLPPFPSMALGTADLTLKEMVRGYATIANGGLQSPTPFFIKKVTDRTGRVLENHSAEAKEQVLDPQATYQLIQCLQGVATSGTGARSNDLGWPVAGKTGTTDDHTDAWFMGFSTRVACGVWVGLDEKKPIFKGADGARVALPIWIGFMKAALPTTPREEFPSPDGMEWADIDRFTGLLATSATTDRVLRLAFKPGTVPKSPSDAEAIQAVKDARDKANGQPMENRVWGRPPTPKVEAPKPVDLNATDPNG